MLLSHYVLPRADLPFLTHRPSCWLWALLLDPPNKQPKLLPPLPRGHLSIQTTRTTCKSNSSKKTHPLLSSLSHSPGSSLTVSLSQEGLIPDGCSAHPVALPNQPSPGTPGTSPPHHPEHPQLLLGKSPSHCPAERAAETTDCRQLALRHPAVFTLSNLQPDSHIKLQKNQLGPLSHGINQKSRHIKKS